MILESTALVSTGGTLDKERAADLIAALNETAAQHGFLLGVEVEQNAPNELVSMKLRFIQTADSALSATDQKAVRRQAVAELEKPPLRRFTPPLEPYDWGPEGMPKGEPIRYEPGKGWKVGEKKKMPPRPPQPTEEPGRRSESWVG